MIANSINKHTAEPEFSARFDRTVVNVKGGSVRHLVIAVKAPAVPRGDGPRQPLNLGLVIDASGSMEGAPLDAAKQATLSLLDKLAATDHLSLVSFASDVICHAEAMRLDPSGRHVIAASSASSSPVARRISLRAGSVAAKRWPRGRPEPKRLNGTG